MGSFKTFNVHKAVFTARLLKVWEKAGELPFAELLLRSMTFENAQRHATDDEIIEALERWVLIDARPADPKPTGP